MVLRAGAKRGPARPWDLVGAGAGVAAVLVLATFVVVAGNRSGYSHVDDPISLLGASGAPAAWWFTAVNLVGAVLIVLFAFGAHRRLPVGLSTGFLLGAVALGAVFVGTVRCSGECLPTASDGHGWAARFTAVMIAGFLVSAAWAQRRGPKGWFRHVTFVCMVANLACLAALFIAVRADGGPVGLFQRLFWATAYLWVLAASVAILLATRRRGEASGFDAAKLQRKILRSSPKWQHAGYAFCSITDPGAVKRWLARAIDGDTGPVKPDQGPAASSVTIAFTCTGLRLLGVKYPRDDAFAAGMRARASLLGDVGKSHPEQWQEPWRSNHVHVMIWVEAEDPRIRGSLLADLRDLDHEHGLEWLFTQYADDIIAAGRTYAVEHLGFRDGISQPWVLLTGRSLDDAQREPGGTLDDFGRWRPLAVGEFVLGERDESDDIARVPKPSEIFHHGSFVVLRKLAQNPDELRRFADAHADLSGVGTTELLELMMGRRRDGRLLDQPEGTVDSEIHHVLFAKDPEGLVCPLGAHIRRANPRDAAGFGTRLSARHRIIRRGMTYRDDQEAPDGWRDGLMFLAVNARLEDQFEFIQNRWLNDGDRQRSGSGHDPIAGCSQAPSNLVLQLESRTVVTAPVPVAVRTMGGEYFFAPSMAGLGALAGWPDHPIG